MRKIEKAFCVGGAYPFTGDAERCPLPQDASINAHTHHDGIPGVKDELWQNAQLHRKHGDVPEDVKAVRGRGLGGVLESVRGRGLGVFSGVRANVCLLELLLLGLLVFLPVLGEGVKQVVDDFR